MILVCLDEQTESLMFAYEHFVCNKYISALHGKGRIGFWNLVIVYEILNICGELLVVYDYGT